MVRISSLLADLKHSKPTLRPYSGRQGPTGMRTKTKSAPDCSRATREHEGASGFRTRLKNRTRQNRRDILPATKKLTFPYKGLEHIFALGLFYFIKKAPD